MTTSQSPVAPLMSFEVEVCTFMAVPWITVGSSLRPERRSRQGLILLPFPLAIRASMPVGARHWAPAKAGLDGRALQMFGVRGHLRGGARAFRPLLLCSMRARRPRSQVELGWPRFLPER